MAVNIGPLPDEIRKQVRVADPLDPNVQPLPSVPWVADLPDLYRQRYGQDLVAVRKSLFEGDTDADRQVRRQYWALVTDLLADRYFGQIQRWARAHSVASSGHILWEEELLHHAALEGNSLKMLSRMDIPGLDVLSSDPEAVIHTGWMTAVLPASAALLNGRRLVMTEVSDFAETMAKKGPALGGRHVRHGRVAGRARRHRVYPVLQPPAADARRVSGVLCVCRPAQCLAARGTAVAARAAVLPDLGHLVRIQACRGQADPGFAIATAARHRQLVHGSRAAHDQRADFVRHRGPRDAGGRPAFRAIQSTSGTGVSRHSFFLPVSNCRRLPSSRSSSSKPGGRVVCAFGQSGPGFRGRHLRQRPREPSVGANRGGPVHTGRQGNGSGRQCRPRETTMAP